MEQDICLSLLDSEEREQLDFMWNLIPEEDREGMTQADVLYVLDLMDEYLEQKGLVEVDEKTGEVTYLDGDVDETEQLEFVRQAIAEGQKEGHCNALTSVQIQLIVDAEVEYGMHKGYYEED